VATQDAGPPAETNGVIFNGGAITINDTAAPPTQATPYPSNITVSGMTGVIAVVNVTINGFSHAFPDDVDILLKGPTGANAIILSDVGGSIAVSNLTINLDDNAAASMSDAGPLTSGTFKPTNVGAGDTFPTQAPSGGSVLSVFNNTNPNGTWSLYVVDDANGQAGSITSWSLNILVATQQCNATAIPISDAGGGNPGLGNPYPSNIVISGVAGNVARVVVTINGLTHTEPDDVDMLLVGPTGARIIFLADVGGTPTATNINLVIDDFAAAQLPDSGGLASGTFKPTVPSEAGGEIFPAPSPCNGAGCFPGDAAAPEGTATFANRFNGTNPNGTWSLYVTDQSGGDTGSITGGWCLTITTGPTLARFSSASATASDDGQVNLKWKTGYEVDNLGFNVYRDEAGERVRVNKQIIAGSAFLAGQGTAMTSGRNYSWRDDSARSNSQYWIEAVAVDGSTTWHGPVSPVHSPGKSNFETQSATLGDLSHGGGATDANDITTSGVVVEAGASGQSALKLSVKQTGYYRVTQPELVAAGLSPGVNPRKLQLFEDGSEQPIIVQGEKDGQFDSGDWVEFYATASGNSYTDTRVYRLVAGSQKGLRVKTAPETNGTGGAESFLFTTELREKNVYYSALRNGDQENFFGAVVTREPVTRTLKLQNVAGSAPDSATLEVAMQGVTTASHNVRVTLNGVDIGAVIFDGQTAGIARLSIAQSSLKEGDNSVQLIAEGGESDVSLTDAIRLSYWHSYAADNNSVQFTAKAGQKVTIAGFSNSAIRVIDLSDVEKGGLRELSSLVSTNGSSHSVTVSIPGTGARTLLAFASDQMKRPAAIRADFASDWRQKSNKADMVIFTRKDFIPALEPLKAHRESQGLKVAIVDIEDAYDEFSFGNKNPQAIKDFLAYATSAWKVKPRFAMFAGDASFDPKNYLGAGDWDIIPTKLIDTQFMEAASDEWFADFNGDGLAELAVGRLPVRSVQELSTVVAKIIGYDSSSPAESLLLVADAGDTFNFEGASDGLRAFIPGNLKALAIARGTTDDETARAQLLNYINQGQRVINYIGHGNLNVWRGELFTSDDASALTNSQHLSLFVAMTCLNGYFQDAIAESLAEALLKAPHGGAVAAWASTGMCDPAEQGVLNQEFYRLLFGGKLTVGEAAMKAKSSVKDKDVRRTWVVIGDPTTRLR
jgi:subtilisin-like proprotein convertase family protein